jgi:hypothetical protein
MNQIFTHDGASKLFGGLQLMSIVLLLLTMVSMVWVENAEARGLTSCPQLSDTDKRTISKLEQAVTKFLAKTLTGGRTELEFKEVLRIHSRALKNIVVKSCRERFSYIPDTWLVEVAKRPIGSRERSKLAFYYIQKRLYRYGYQL